MKRELGAHLSLLLATLIFGLNYWISKSIMPDYLNPFQIVFFRTLGCAILFWLISLFTRQEKIQKKDWKLIILTSLTGVTLNQTLFFSGLNLTSPVDASIIHVANPIIVLLFSVLFGREVLTGWKTAGMLTGAIGAVIIILSGNSYSAADSSVTGNILITINITFWALYLVLVKSLMMRYPVITVMKWLFLLGFVFALPFTLPEIKNVDFQIFSTSVWLSLAYIVLFNTFLAYFLTNFSLKTLTPSVTSYYIFLQPLIVSVIAVITGKGTLTGYKILAAIIIIAGVWIVTRRSEKMPERN